MDKKILEKIKKDLIGTRKQILEDLKNITEKSGEHRVKFPELGDKMEENVLEIDQYSTNLATDRVLESSLRDIDSALKRIEEGKYGICKYCGEEIGEKRLLARPVASACVSCKNKLQRAG